MFIFNLQISSALFISLVTRLRKHEWGADFTSTANPGIRYCVDLRGKNVELSVREPQKRFYRGDPSLVRITLIAPKPQDQFAQSGLTFGTVRKAELSKEFLKNLNDELPEILEDFVRGEREPHTYIDTVELSSDRLRGAFAIQI